jgi:PST family polysaccharide transporter
MVRYGRGIVGANGLNYWARNTDNLLVGKWLGSAQLGLYNRAYSLMLLPMNLISRVVTSVLFPVLMKQQDDMEKMRENFLRVCARVGFIAFPLMGGMGACADALVRTLFGERWLPVVRLLQFLAPLGLYQTIVSLYGPIYLALGRTDLDFKVSLFVELTLIGAIVGGLHWGIPGLVAGLYAAAIVNFWPTNVLPLRLIQLPLRMLARSLSSPFAAALIMVGAVVVVGRALGGLPAPLTLTIQVLTGVTVYAACCHFMRVETLYEVTNLVRTRWQRRRAG